MLLAVALCCGINGSTAGTSTDIINCYPVAGGFMLEWIPGSGAVVKWTPDLVTTPFTDLSAKLPSTQSSYIDTVHGTDDQCFYRVELDAPEGMVLIPAGTFQMGDTFAEGSYIELPVHEVYISSFYMGKYEVTNDEMLEVMQWAHDHGKLTVSSASVQNAQGNQQELLDLDIESCRITWSGSAFGIKSAKGSGYPCVEVSWYGAVAYCNYRSEKEGRTPCYNLADWSCDWSANGYRLPTEAEWEKAARGGLNGKRYGWGDLIDYSKANYGIHPVYWVGDYPYTSPVGSFAPTGYGLYDMEGNVCEWCSDWYDNVYYATSPSSNPRGPSSGGHRMRRGGSWNDEAWDCRSANRAWYGPGLTHASFGFRVCLSAE
jgi:sulfatase modifying factor 1